MTVGRIAWSRRVALPSGPCVIEKRLVDIVLRHGFNEMTVAKWRAIFALYDEFSAAVGESIYALLPGVRENTFNAFHLPRVP